MKSVRILSSMVATGAFCFFYPQPVAGQTCTFSWEDQVSGSYTDAARWTTSPGAPASCRNRAPRPGESVAFRPGTYTVSIPGGQSALVAEFDVGQNPADITFDIGETFDVRALATSGTLTVKARAL